MSLPPAILAQGPVLVLAPTGRDGTIITSALRREGILSIHCADMECFCAEMEEADAGIIAEEALQASAVSCLSAALGAQPPWSDFPLIVLGLPHRSSGMTLFHELAGVANLTLLERPMRTFTLLTVTKAALRARGRQYLTRKHLQELVHARENLARHRDELQEAVSKRTEELQATNQLLRLSERMASIGALAAGLGHDLANLLLPVHAALHAIEHSPPETATVHLARVRKSLEYVGKLAASLRLLSLDPDRGGGHEESETDLAGWWEDLTPLLQMALPKGARLDASLEPGLRVRLAPHRLTQAVLNLVSNAGDAIRSTGAVGSVTVTAALAPDGATALLTVGDDGPGMPEEVRRRCLEPLFTTGSHERATGLGLSLVAGIVRAAGGEILVESEVGVGTRVRISVPGRRATEESHRAQRLAVVTVGDARMCSILDTILTRNGFLVERRLTGAREPSHWFTDATDAAAEMAAELRDRCPGVRIVVMGEPGPAWDGVGVRSFPHGPSISELRAFIQCEARDKPDRSMANGGTAAG